MATLRTVLVIIWASPATMLGLFAVLLGLVSGGQISRRGRVIEFSGGFVKRLLRWRRAAALTLGHVVLGLDQQALDDTREHELVHVEQYERWGPAFLPAYGLCALALWLTGRQPYWDNPFEREAYRRAP